MYKIDVSKHFHIWFSKDEDKFLNDENQLRLVHMRADNPEAKISFVYSSSLLNDKAKKEMTDFCSQHHITPIDFDKDLQYLLYSDEDMEIYKLAKNELELWKDNKGNSKGGNPAAASDYLRWLPGLILKAGIYDDFDVNINFSEHLSSEGHLMEVNGPLVIPCAYIPEIQNTIYLNDFIAFALNEKGNRLHKDSLDIIRKVQKKLIEAGSDFSKAKEILEKSGDSHTNSILKKLLYLYTKETNQLTLQGFRQFIENIDIKTLLTVSHSTKELKEMGMENVKDVDTKELKEKYGALIRQDTEQTIKATNIEIADAMISITKSNVYKHTVMDITGPNILATVFADMNSDNISTEQSEELKTAVRSPNFNYALLACSKMLIPDNNPIDNFLHPDPTAESEGGDVSWMSDGKRAQERREEAYNQAAKIMQKAWKQYKSRKTSPTSKETNLPFDMIDL